MPLLDRLAGLSRRLVWFMLPLVCVGLMSTLRSADPGGLWQRVQFAALDGYHRLAPRTIDLEAAPARHQPWFVAIDERSLERFGQWPWTRDILAAVVDSLYARGARVVALDMILSEPDRASPAAHIEALERAYPELREPLSRVDLRLNYDEELGNVVTTTPTVLAVGLAPDGDAPVPAGISVVGVGHDPIELLPDHLRVTAPIPELRHDQLKLGHVSVLPEKDGIVRRMPMLVRAGGELYPSLALAILAELQGETTIFTHAERSGLDHELSRVRMGDLVIPVARDGGMPLRFPARLSERQLSMVEVLDGAHDGLLRESVVIIGASAVGLRDLHDTPVGKLVPGPLFHLWALEQLMHRDLVRRDSAVIGAEWLMAWVASLLLAAFVVHERAITGTLALLAIGGGVLWASWAMFENWGWMVDWSWPLGAMLGTFLMLILVRIIVEERSKAQIRSAFSIYLAPPLVERIARNPQSLQLGGESKELTILFADVRGFTTISEQFVNDPEGLTQLVNSLLTPLSAAIQERRGTIDKYIGDAIMAFWNAPLDVPDHPQHACLAALDMHKRLRFFNEESSTLQRMDQTVRIGIGINTGTVTVGNMGSDQRFDYSCLGDAVNVASRLEGLCKYFGVDLIVGNSTVEGLSRPEDLILLKLGEVKVKGKSAVSAPHWLAGHAGETDKEALVEPHDMLVNAVYDGDWERATRLATDVEHLPGYPPGLVERYRWLIEQRRDGVIVLFR